MEATVDGFGGDCRFELFLVDVGEPITRGTKEEPVLVEVVACGPVAARGVVLYAAAHVTWRGAGGLATWKAPGTLVASLGWSSIAFFPDSSGGGARSVALFFFPGVGVVDDQVG